MHRNRLPFSLSFAAVFALALGFACTGVLFVETRRLEHDKLQLDFRQKATARILAIQQQLDQTIQVLQTQNQLFATFPLASRQEFDKFTKPLLRRHPYIQSFNFQRSMTGRGDAADELRMRQRYSGFVSMPQYGSNNGLGRSDELQLTAVVHRAIDTGHLFSTGLLHLGSGHRKSIMVVMPVYSKDMLLGGSEARRKALIGDTVTVFDAAGLIEKILNDNGMQEDPSIGLSVYVGNTLDARNLVFQKAVSADQPAALSLPTWMFPDLSTPIVHDFDVAGRMWKVAVSPQPAILAQHHTGSLFTLAGGILFSVLLAAFTQMFSWRSLRVRQLVEERTAELEFQANRDTLTGLANRNLLHDRIEQASAFAHRYGKSVWVLFINLDRFKFVNDTLGHWAGDQLLIAVAQRLQLAVRQTDTVARLSADEFVLVLPERAEEQMVPTVIQRIMGAVSQPVVIEGHEFVMGASVGIAVCPSDGNDADSLVKHAGIAMYRAKELGRNNFQFYMPAMNERAMERLRMEGDLRNALERKEFVLHYQPQVALASGQVIGVEALIRWQHPVLGMVPPGRFIALAEDVGLIVPIGLWVLRTACRQSVEWQQAGIGPLRVAVNLSARQFYQHDLVASIRSILDETGLAPHLLELELTESMMMNDVEHAVAIMHKLKELGVQLSIDDFGTGYSSLAYLKRFPIDVLKIDKSFVRDISVDTDDAAIVLSIISLAHSLRLKVVAEGVETAAQLAYLQRHCCDYMQGYYFSRALPVVEAEHLLRRGTPMPLPAEMAGPPSQRLLIVDEHVSAVVPDRLRA